MAKVILIANESNRLERRSSGGPLAIDERITTYDDHDEWYRFVVPRLREIGVRAVAEAVGMSEPRVRHALAGRGLPHPGHGQELVDLVSR
jgi:hypothetical protein